MYNSSSCSVPSPSSQANPRRGSARRPPSSPSSLSHESRHTAAATSPPPPPQHTTASTSLSEDDGIHHDSIPLPTAYLASHARYAQGIRSTTAALLSITTTTTTPSPHMSANPAQEAFDSLQPISPATSPPTLSRNSTSNSIPRPVATMDGALPENDGMNSLRQKLQEIRQLAVSTEEKAQRMHYLMMQDYMAHRTSLPSPGASPDARGRVATEGRDEIALLHAPPAVDLENPYNIQPGDLEPVYSPLPPNRRDEDMDAAMEDDDEEDDEEEEMPDLGCMHYKRNVKVQCFDCHLWFPCRHCHDQSHNLPFPHTLNRKKTKNMLCMLCLTPQPAAEICSSCGEYAAYYFCPICKLWDNDPTKRIYHCNDCGICRVGEGLGKDFVHCQRCNVCLTINTFDNHTCIERATEGDCPLCLVVLFDSRTPVVAMPCGHYMHGECFKDLMTVTYKCPVCGKSAVNMELSWRRLDDEIAAQPMPEGEDLAGLLPTILSGEEGVAIEESGVVGGGAVEGDVGVDAATTTNASNSENHAQTTTPLPTESSDSAAPPAPAVRRPREVWVHCNDCLSKCWTPFHWLGLKCQRCDSYNTNQMAPTAVHETETERLLRQQTTAVQGGVLGREFTGEAVLLSAGIGVDAATDTLSPDLARGGSGHVPPANAQLLDVPSSPATHPVRSPPSSPGRYFVDASSSSPPNEPRRPSFTTPRFTAPSMPNLPTLSSLSAASPGLPRLPRLPNLPNLDAMRGLGFPRVPGGLGFGSGERLGDGWMSPYEMMSAVGRRVSLSPMRYYLNGMDEVDRRDQEAERAEGDERGGVEGEEREAGGWSGAAGLGEMLGGGLRAGLERRASAWSEPGVVAGWMGRERWGGKAGEDGESEEEDDGDGDSDEDEDEEMLGDEEEEEEEGRGLNPLDELEILGHR